MLIRVVFHIGTFVKTKNITTAPSHEQNETDVERKNTDELGKAAFQMPMHGISQGFIAGVSGGDFFQGFWSAAVSSVVSSATGGLNAATGLSGTAGDISTMFFGTVSGGLSAKLSGGNFWQGAAIGLTVSGLNHVAHSSLNKYVKVKIKTTDNVVENGTTDAIRPKLELKFRIRISDGYVDRGALKIIDEGAVLDQEFSNNNSGDWVSEALNDGHIYNPETNTHSYSLNVEGSATLGFNVPGKLGSWIPTSVDWNYKFNFQYQQTILPFGINWNHNVKMNYSKYGFNANTMRVGSKPTVIFE